MVGKTAIFFVIFVLVVVVNIELMLRESAVEINIDDCGYDCSKGLIKYALWPLEIVDDTLILAACQMICIFDEAFDVIDVWTGDEDSYKVFFIPISGPCDSMTELEKKVANIVIGIGILMLLGGIAVGEIIKDGIYLTFGTAILMSIHCGRLGFPPIPVFYLIEAFLRFVNKIIGTSPYLYTESENSIGLIFLGILLILAYCGIMKIQYGSLENAIKEKTKVNKFIIKFGKGLKKDIKGFRKFIVKIKRNIWKYIKYILKKMGGKKWKKIRRY